MARVQAEHDQAAHKKAADVYNTAQDAYKKQQEKALMLKAQIEDMEAKIKSGEGISRAAPSDDSLRRTVTLDTSALEVGASDEDSGAPAASSEGCSN